HPPRRRGRAARRVHPARAPRAAGRPRRAPRRRGGLDPRRRRYRRTTLIVHSAPSTGGPGPVGGVIPPVSRRRRPVSHLTHRVRPLSALIGLALFAPAAPAALAAQDALPPAATLVAKHVAAVGGEAAIRKHAGAKI